VINPSIAFALAVMETFEQVYILFPALATPLLTLCLLQAIDGPWNHPGLFHLDVPSLIIEANSRLAIPFKMPQDMRRIVQHLALHYPSVTTLQSLRLLPWEEILGSLGLDGDVAEFATQLSSYGERGQP
jgi:hypothetical protein